MSTIIGGEVFLPTGTDKALELVVTGSVTYTPLEGSVVTHTVRIVAGQAEPITLKNGPWSGFVRSDRLGAFMTFKFEAVGGEVDLYALMHEGKLAATDPMFNDTVIRTTRNGIEYIEQWSMVNARYDAKRDRFMRIDLDKASFGIQMQASGTYPGEEGFGDFVNQGINYWRAAGRELFRNAGDTASANAVTEDIGYQASGGSWQTFGVQQGWSNSFMIDSYGGMTVGGAGFEIDGNGLYPYTRVSLSKSFEDLPDKRAYNGRIWNQFHQMQGRDDPSKPSVFYGFEAPMDLGQGEYGNEVDIDNAQFVVKSLPVGKAGNLEDWTYLLRVDRDGALYSGADKVLTTARQDIVKVTTGTFVDASTFSVGAYPDSTWNESNTLIIDARCKVGEEWASLDIGKTVFTQYGFYGLYSGATPAEATNLTFYLRRV